MTSRIAAIRAGMARGIDAGWRWACRLRAGLTHATRRFATSKRLVSALALLWLLSITLVLIFHDPRPVNTIEAVTERVSQRVVQPGLSAFSLHGHGLISDDPFAETPVSECLDGLFTPVAGAVVDYQRGLDGVLRISVTPPSGALSAGHAEMPLPQGPLHFIALPACDAAQAPRRLPLWGAAILGDDLRAATGSSQSAALLIGGEIRISARSISLFGVLPPSLYHIDTIPLPPGSRVSESGISSPPRGTLWAGFVEITPDAPALRLHAVTDARNLMLYLPGQGVSAQSLRLGLLVPVFQDPYLLMVQIILASMLIVWQALIVITDFHTRKKES